MDNKVKNFALYALRKASLRWKPRTDTLKEARISRGMYICAGCKLPHRRKNVNIDHVLPVVPVEGWPGFDLVIERMFCEKAGFQILCQLCHQLKTQEENKQRGKPSENLDEKRKKG